MKLEIYNPVEQAVRLKLRPSFDYPDQICLSTVDADGDKVYDLLRISAEGIYRFAGCDGCGIATEGAERVKLLS